MAISRVRRDLQKPNIRNRRRDYVAWPKCRLADVVIPQSVLNIGGVFAGPKCEGSDVLWVPPDWSMLYLVIESHPPEDNRAYYILIKEDRSWVLEATTLANNSFRIVPRTLTNLHLKIGLSHILAGQ